MQKSTMKSAGLMGKMELTTKSSETSREQYKADRNLRKVVAQFYS